ncbi:hypothetical protein [Brevibacterium aurantiacum]|uniref:Uncharacterized protein n=1 Tax=Brevibacterium aurantiacum TaxID=273384 RepID=A0A2H1KN66_BREAU|nr:hypothetical protein [Brevibacterium aurantiacum]SMY01141.1 hypothetical protein BAURA63_03509 [Brevibacterium aurantiacum]
MNTPTRIPAAIATVTRSTLGDSTNGGISANAARIAVVGTIDDHDTTVTRLQPAYCDGNVHLTNDEDSTSTPCVAVWIGHVLGQPSAHLIPIAHNPTTDTFTPAPGRHMAGGNWGIGGPSLARVVSFLLGEPILGHFHAALPIHDRTE